MERDELLLRNMIRLADDHRKHCDQDCNISLSYIAELLSWAGIAVSSEDYTHFI